MDTHVQGDDSAKDLAETLTANFMVVRVAHKCWSGQKTDKKATQEVIANNNAVADAGRFTKKLMAGADAELKAVHKAGEAVRNYVKENTLPWSRPGLTEKSGERLKETTELLNLLQGAQPYVAAHAQAVRDLVAVWPQKILDAQANLNGLANADEYPSAQDLPKYFGIDIDWCTIPTPTDFDRLNVPAKLAKAYAKKYTNRVDQKLKGAMDELRERMGLYLKRFQTQMEKTAAEDKGTQLRESLISNLQAAVKMAKEMASLGSPQLVELVNDIEQKLLSRRLSEYKSSPAAAQAAAAAAQELQVVAALDEVWETL